jgi:hypothetical protein
MSIDFADKIRSKNGKSSGKKKFNTMFKSLPKVYRRDNVDPEAAMSVIASINERERLKDNIADRASMLCFSNA